MSFSPKKKIASSLVLFLVAAAPIHGADQARIWVRAEKRDVEEIWRSRGALRSGTVTEIRSPITAVVDAVHCEVGKAVKKGQTLLTFKAPDGPEIQRRQAWTDSVLCPADGAVLSVSVKPGQVVFGRGEFCAPTPVVKLALPGPALLHCTIPGSYRHGRIKAGLFGKAVFVAAEPQPVVIEEIADRGKLAVIRPMGAEAWFGEGGARVDIVVETHKNSVAVPVEALTREKGETYVTKIKGGRREKIIVKPGISDGTWVSILEGVEKGERIVVPEGKRSDE